MKLKALFLILLLCAPQAFAAEKAQPRVLIGLYDSRESIIRATFTHRFLEMPANHLGYVINYYDINKPLPPLTDDIAGVMVWLSPGLAVADPLPYLDWLEKVVAAKKKLVIVENAGISGKWRDQDRIMQRYNSILSYIGVQDSDMWNAVTYRSKILVMDNSMVSFERPIGPIFPPYGSTRVIPGSGESHLKINPHNNDDDEPVDLVITSKNGGFITEGYAIFQVIEKDESRIIQWFVNPFMFLESSLNGGFRPIPDVTTLSGKRIFYSHIDGDGWNNLTEVAEYSKEKTLSAEVLRKEIFEPFKDFAFTVGLIIDDIDLDCYGVPGSEKAARDIYALPNVEPGSHTWSHPLFWGYFEHYDPADEAKLSSRFPARPKMKSSMFENIKDAGSKTVWADQPATNAGKTTTAAEKSKISTALTQKDKKLVEGTSEWFETENYDIPRSYACSNFDLDQEITGSAARINALLPKGKTVELIQWSGDTSPFELALAKTRQAGYYNINGGDSRFDNEYPSYSTVAPIGLQVGNERQIYSSNSNENTYTDLWTDRFFGFRYLQKTVENTESPMRVSPFNIYFHIYSGQKLASLLAVKENLQYARKHNLIRLATSQYAAIASSFYSVKVTQLADNKWKIANKRKMETMRFDNSRLKSVDFANSQGIIGQNYFQGSLYVQLDPTSSSSIIVLNNIEKLESPPLPPTPYLMESSWLINRLQYIKNLLIIQANGYGPGNIKLRMPKVGKYHVKASTLEDKPEILIEKDLTADKEGVILFTLESKDVNALTEVTVVEIK